MSTVKHSHTLWSPADTFKDVAEALGITNLPEEVSKTLAMDVEYRLHEIIEQALKFMKHSKRSTLTTSDISHALRVLNVEPLYGYETSRALNYREALVGPGQTLYYIDDEDEVDFEQIINQPLPKVPREVSFTAHWLAIEGVQPAIPQNPQSSEIRAMPPQLRGSQTSNSVAAMANEAEIKPLVRHVISRELQLYFDTVVSAIMPPSDNQAAQPDAADVEAKRQAALQSLRSDPGLHQLTPYFVQFAQEKISQNLKSSYSIVSTMLEVVDALVHNPTIFIEPYIHHIMPVVLTPLLAKQTGSQPITNETYHIRDYAASLLEFLCQNYGPAFQTLKPRAARTLLKGFLDLTRPTSAMYGSLAGIAALGPEVVRVVVVGNLKAWYEGVVANQVSDEDKDKLRDRLLKTLRVLLKQAPPASELTKVDPEVLQDKVGADLAHVISSQADGDVLAFAILMDDLVKET